MSVSHPQISKESQRKPSKRYCGFGNPFAFFPPALTNIDKRLKWGQLTPFPLWTNVASAIFSQAKTTLNWNTKIA